MIVDCRDVLCDTIRLGDGRSNYFTNLDCSAFRFGFGVMPYGGIGLLLTEPCSARAAELAIMHHHREAFHIVPRNMEIMADEGFPALSAVIHGHQFVHVPSFAAKNVPQFTSNQVASS